MKNIEGDNVEMRKCPYCGRVWLWIEKKQTKCKWCFGLNYDGKTH